MSEVFLTRLLSTKVSCDYKRLDLAGGMLNNENFKG